MEESKAVERIYNIIVKGARRPWLHNLILGCVVTFPALIIAMVAMFKGKVYEAKICVVVWLCLLLFVGLVAKTINSYIDIDFPAAAVISFFLAHDEPLLRIISLNRLPGRAVLEDPGVMFAIGHLLRKRGYLKESADIIEKALAANPKLAGITVPEGDAEMDEGALCVVMEGMREMARHNIPMRIMSVGWLKKALLIVFFAIIALNFLAQVINIFLRFVRQGG